MPAPSPPPNAMTARLPLLPLLLVSLLLAACSHKHAEGAWTKAHWGMSVAEVRGAVPAAATGAGGHIVTGATAELHLDKTEVAGTTLPADFYFLDGKLTQISFNEDAYHDNEVNAKAFDRIAGVLRKQFGPEASSKVADSSLIGLSRDTTWVAGDTEILLGVAPVTGATSMLLLNYRRAVR